MCCLIHGALHRLYRRKCPGMLQDQRLFKLKKGGTHQIDFVGLCKYNFPYPFRNKFSFYHFPLFPLQFCLKEEYVWRCVLAWAKNHAGVTQPTAHWTEEERARVCQHLQGVMCHVRLLLIESQVFAEEVEPTGAVPMELSLERYRYAALLNSNKTGVHGGGGLGGSGGGGGFSSGSSNKTETDKRLQPRLTVNMFPGSQILRNEKLHLQSVLNNW